MEIISKSEFYTDEIIQEEPEDLESRLKNRRNVLRKTCEEKRLTGAFQYQVEKKLFTYVSLNL